MSLNKKKNNRLTAFATSCLCGSLLFAIGFIKDYSAWAETAGGN